VLKTKYQKESEQNQKKEQPKIEIIITPRNMIHNFDWPLDIFELFSHTLGRERINMIKDGF